MKPTHPLRALRQELGLTLEAVSARSGVSKGLISKIERRAVVQPRPETVRRLVDGCEHRLAPADFLPPIQDERATS